MKMRHKFSWQSKQSGVEVHFDWIADQHLHTTIALIDSLNARYSDLEHWLEMEPIGSTFPFPVPTQALDKMLAAFEANAEARELIAILRDETQSRAVRDRCIAIVGERTP